MCHSGVEKTDCRHLEDQYLPLKEHDQYELSNRNCQACSCTSLKFIASNYV